MTNDNINKIRNRALRKGDTARGASINETLEMVDSIQKMTEQFIKIAKVYELCGEPVSECGSCRLPYRPVGL